MMHIIRAALCALIVVTGFTPAFAAEAPEGFDADRHLRVSEVEPGMRGYGLTVFQGSTPEPFEVEVVSVEQGFEPGKAVVWVRCPDERMQQSGPVQGMSGSPIYIWTDDPAEGEEQVIGEGGKLLGAFAFGHRFGKDCYVGVQPIEQMLDAGSRATGNPPKAAAQAAGVRKLTLNASHQLARQSNLDEDNTWRLNALSELVSFKPSDSMPGLESEIAALQQGGQSVLPLQMGSGRHAEALAPFFTPLGLFPTASQRGMAGGSAPPPWIQGDDVKLEPGSVLAIPLAFGPMEMSAMGTATEVLPDGRVLGFGHSMFAQGDIAVPMATGYVHFIQPNVQVSFKLGASLDVQGAIVRDEATAVVGRPDGEFRTVPATVRFNWPNGNLSREYEYELVHHEQLLPGLIASVAMDSMVTDVELPEFNTLHIRGTINFDNGRSVQIDDMMANATATGVVLSVVPPLGTLIDTEFGSVGVESVDLDIDIRDEARIAQITDVTLERGVVRPGETIVADVELLPFRDEPVTRQVEIAVPENLADGQYMIMIGGGSAYQQHLSQLKPHRSLARNEQELFEAVQDILDIRTDALYGVLTLNPNAADLAVGRTEMPRLPSSRQAILRVDSSTRATQYVDGIEQIQEQPFVVSGGIMMPVEVKREASAQR